MRLIDADTLKENMMIAFGCENATKYGNKDAEQQAHSYSTLMLYEISNIVEDCIDNAPTVETKFELKTENGITYPNALDNMTFSHILSVEERQNIIQAYMLGANANARPQGTCKTCRCRDPEDKKCDCGALERQGCPFPVSDGYYCKYYEEGGAV